MPNGNDLWCLIKKYKIIAGIIVTILSAGVACGMAYKSHCNKLTNATNDVEKIKVDRAKEAEIMTRERKQNRETLLIIQERQGVIQTKQAEIQQEVKGINEKVQSIKLEQKVHGTDLKHIIRKLDNP